MNDLLVADFSNARVGDRIKSLSLKRYRVVDVKEIVTLESIEYSERIEVGLNGCALGSSWYFFFYHFDFF